MGKRGTPCGVCAHDKRHLIEVGLTYGTPARVLGQRFGLSKFAVLRHARNHLTPQLRAAILAAQKPEVIDLDALRTTETEGLLGHLVGQRARLLQLSHIALEQGDVRGTVAAEGAIGANLALEARLLGQLIQRHDVRHSSILLTPDYLAMRQVLMHALRPFPDASKAVGAALHAIESDAAKDITDTAGAGRAQPLVIDHKNEPC